MLTFEQITQTAHRAAAEASQPVRVILPGSYARGDADTASDLALLVVERELPDKAAEYRERYPTGSRKRARCFMTPQQREEAERLLRPAQRDSAE